MAPSSKCILALYGYALNDPVCRQAAVSLSGIGYEVTILQLGPAAGIVSSPPPKINVAEVETNGAFKRIKPLQNWLRWIEFKHALENLIAAQAPDLVVTVMLHALAALPSRRHWPKAKLVSCIYDIPPLEDAGRLDRRIIPKGWRALQEADVVWSSDSYKAQLAQECGGLNTSPLVCHNCPPLNYLPEPTWPRDSWLRNKLRDEGASIGNEGGCIMLRAGAVGECGGIEETLDAMVELPNDFIFLLMGRPSIEYKTMLLKQIEQLGLQHRAFLWDRPSDEVWKKSFQGADIGHLIHGPFPAGQMARMYELNSSLSNYRLFYYMAAGLPIISYDDPRMSGIVDEVPCFRVAPLSSLKEDILKAWRELGSDSDLQKQFGESGRAAHVNKYNWEFQFFPLLKTIECVFKS